MKTFFSKCLAKNIKLSSFLKGNPSNISIFIVNLVYVKFVCLKF